MHTGPIFVCKLEMTGLLYAGYVGFCEAATGTNSQRAWLILSELLMKGVVIITCSLSESYRRAQCSEAIVQTTLMNAINSSKKGENT